MSISINIGNQHNLIVQFPYNPKRVEKIKRIHGRVWNVEQKYWSIPHTEGNLKQLIQLFGNDELTFEEALRPILERIDHPLNPLTNDILMRMEQVLKLKGYSPKTRKSYVGHIERLARHLNLNLDSISEIDIRRYLLVLLDEQKRSHSYVNTAVSAIKFCLQHVLKKGNIAIDVPRPKKQQKLPAVNGWSFM